MASIRKAATGWRVEIYISKIRESKTFGTKAECHAWAVDRAAHLRKFASVGILADRTMNDAIEKYTQEVSSKKTSGKSETARLTSFAGKNIKDQVFGEIRLTDLTPTYFANWRDYRLGVDKVKGSTVNREFKIFNDLFNIAKNEWKWITENPLKGVKRAKEPPPRDRRITEDEIERLCFAMGFNEEPVTTKTASVAIAFLFAIETAMRAGEILSLTKDSVNGNVAHLTKTKNGDKRRVPLSPRALELLNYLPKDGETLFNLSTDSLDALFRKCKNKCAINGLTFHDTRHEAITRLAKKLQILDLARMVGHRNLKELMTYYNETAENIAKLL